ncbi:MAG: M23 family metallopeptidase, partial [Eubacteriales bacterium]
LGLPEGTIVQQGDVIGYVGTTGSSTGNHLHLEVRLNDARVDPINVYAGKALYIGGALIT